MSPTFAAIDSVIAIQLRRRTLAFSLDPSNGPIPLRALAHAVPRRLTHRKRRDYIELGVIQQEHGSRYDPLEEYLVGVLSDQTTFEVAEFRSDRQIRLYLNGEERWHIERVDYQLDRFRRGICRKLTCCPVVQAWRVFEAGQRIGHVCRPMFRASNPLLYRDRSPYCLPLCVSECPLEDFRLAGRWAKGLWVAPPEEDDWNTDLVMPAMPSTGSDPRDPFLFLMNIAARALSGYFHPDTG